MILQMEITVSLLGTSEEPALRAGAIPPSTLMKGIYPYPSADALIVAPIGRARILL